MGIELEQLHEVHQQGADVHLVLSQLVLGWLGEVTLALETPQQEHCEHRPVEDVAHLALVVVVDQVEVVPVIPGHVGLLLLLGLAAGLVMVLKQVPVVLEPLQRLLRNRPGIEVRLTPMI